jgi:formylglycine-generating enzyme required for sulfatase activity
MIPGVNGYRLPTEAEWEYACKAGTGTVFSSGDTLTGSQANIDYIHGKTIKVGCFAPNPWGLYDMHGNIWEWCWDWVYYGGDNY